MRDLTARENLWKIQVELGGGLYRGVQPGKQSIGLCMLILFDDAEAEPENRSTMAIRPCDLTAAAVQKAISEQRALYEKSPLPERKQV